MEFKFQRNRIDKIPREKIIEELEKVAKQYNYQEFTCKEFNKFSDISFQVILREFGSWKNALKFLKNHLESKKISLNNRIKPKRKDFVSYINIFIEMERIWKTLGHRPSKTEWEKSKPLINYNTVYRHFNGWTNACMKFVEYKMGKVIVSETQSRSLLSGVNRDIKQEEKREIPLKIRLEVLKRDCFKCVFCGRSPAIHTGVVLHIDHKIPFQKVEKQNFLIFKLYVPNVTLKKVIDKRRPPVFHEQPLFIL